MKKLSVLLSALLMFSAVIPTLAQEKKDGPPPKEGSPPPKDGAKKDGPPPKDGAKKDGATK
jgi:hypothetical protein